MNTRRVLMFAYHFPPQGGIASLRAWRFARLLREFGWEALVVTPERAENVRDASLTFAAERTVRTGNFELSRAGRKALGLAAGQAGQLARRSLLGWLRDWTRRWAYRPDSQIGWYPFALTAARRLLRERRVHALFSTSYPLTAHVVARRLSRESGLPWVSDFRDLWTDWSQERDLRQRLDEALELAVLREAAAVTSVSPTYVETLERRGARRAVLLTNAYDESAFGGAAPVPEPATFAYLGTYYPGFQNHLDTALHALGRLAARGFGPRLRFIGLAPRGLDARLGDSNLAGRVAVTGYLPHAAAVAELRRARVLFFAGPHTCDTAVQRGNIAAKVFDYLASRRPILVVGHPDSDVARILRPFPRARCVPPGDVAGAERALQELAAWSGTGDEPPIEHYGSRAVTARLAALLDEVA